jgi:lantibiotic modifying enzyme
MISNYLTQLQFNQNLFHFKIYKHERYLQAAKTCAEVIWKRGILKKGYGICHGVAGNGYALLQVYQCTGVSFCILFLKY